MEQLDSGGMDAVSVNESWFSWAVSVCVWVKDSEANFKPDVVCGQLRSKAERVERAASGQTDELFFQVVTESSVFALL